MKKTVITFGLISGGLLAAMTAVMVPLCLNGTIDTSKSEVLGYTAMVLSFLLVFFGIRAHRENIGGGTITFGKAFKVGILITLITCAVYVVSWEIVYYNFIPDFADRYSELTLRKVRSSGASPAKIEVETKKMAQFKELYKNPFINVGMTFMEVFPVGLVVTLVSAAILRRRATPGSPAGAAAVSS